MPTHQKPDSRIPKGLNAAEHKVYENLIEVQAKRKNQHPPRVLVISDIAKDYNDLTAWVTLKELHRLKLIELKGFITNLIPVHLRARYGRGALDSLGLHHIPVAYGTDAITGTMRANHEQQSHEFDGVMFMAPETTVFGTGESLIHQVYSEAERGGYKISLLLISSLTDIANFAKRHPDLLAHHTADVNMQGGHDVLPNGKLIARTDATNNKFDSASAQLFLDFIHAHKIPSKVYTKIPAVSNLPVPFSLFKTLADTGHPIGERLEHTQHRQEKAFYAKACETDPEKRFQPYMNQEWYLRNKSTWWTARGPDGKPIHGPKIEKKTGVAIPGTEVWPKTFDDAVKYLNVLILYDAFPAVSVAGDDVIKALGLLKLGTKQRGARHKVIGEPEHIDEHGNKQAADPGIDKRKFAVAIEALLKGSLLAVQQGIRSW